jgi:hypothetical protein
VITSAITVGSKVRYITPSNILTHVLNT